MGESSKTDNTVKPVKFWDGVKAEFQKISWPNKDTLIKQSIAVVIVAIVSGVLISLLDVIFQYGVNFITTL